MAQWLEAEVVRRTDWNDHLFSLSFTCEGFPAFKAGQFTKIGLMQDDGKVLSRPYSLVNAPGQDELEIIAVPVEEGKLSPRLHELNPGDALQVMSPATGFLVLDEVPQSQTLWLVATGTGVGPFLSILADGQVWEKYQQVALVYGVRHESDLAYGDLVATWQRERPEQFRYVPIVSREAVAGALQGRIPQLFADQQIQSASELTINAEDSQVMLCGNPDMIQDAMQVLEQMGLRKHLRRSPGQISMERYW